MPGNRLLVGVFPLLTSKKRDLGVLFAPQPLPPGAVHCGQPFPAQHRGRGATPAAASPVPLRGSGGRTTAPEGTEPHEGHRARGAPSPGPPGAPSPGRGAAGRGGYGCDPSPWGTVRGPGPPGGTPRGAPGGHRGGSPLTSLRVMRCLASLTTAKLPLPSVPSMS